MAPKLRIMKGTNVKGNPKKKRNKPKNIDPILPVVSSFTSHYYTGPSIMNSSSSLRKFMPPSQSVP